MASERDEPEEMYDSMTLLLRPGNWDRATDELKDNTTFAAGVLDSRIEEYTVTLSQTPMRFVVYEGKGDADYDYYLVVDDLPGSFNAYGFDEEDYDDVMEGFEKCPVVMEW